MVSFVYAAFDAGSQRYAQPEFAQNEALATRSLKMGITKALKDSEESFLFWDDVSFYHVGDFDDESGIFTSVTPPQLMFHASAVVNETLN